MAIDKITPIPPFKRWTLENFPFIEEDFDAITNYQLYCKIVEYIKKVAANQNVLDGQIDYVVNYFDNLNVQEEINNKLDEMVEDGTIESLLVPIVETYIIPLINEQNRAIEGQNLVITQQNDRLNNFNTTLNLQNDRIEEIDDKVDSAVSGSPLVAESAEDMTDTTKIYVLTTDGHWYWYDGTEWVDGGVYQSTGISESDPVIQKINNKINIIGGQYFTNLMLLFRAGTINNSGGDSTNADYKNNTSRSEYVLVRKGSTITVNTVECTIYFYNKSTYAYESNTVVSGATYYFSEDKLVRFKLYSSGGDINARSSVGEALSSAEEITNNGYINYVQANTTSNSPEYGTGLVTVGYIGGNAKYALSKVMYFDPCYIYLPNIYQGHVSKVKSDGSFDTFTFDNNRCYEIKESGYYVISFYNNGGINYSDLANTSITIAPHELNKGINSEPELVYHRGLSAFYPENTLPAFGAVKKYGGKYFECDVQLSSNGDMICIHDSTIDRTTNGTGNVADLTTTQIQSYYIDEGYQNTIFGNTLRVPTIEEVLQYCSTKGLIPMLELKVEINYNTLINYLKKYNLYDKAIIISFNLNYLKALRAIDKNILIAYLSETYSTSVLYNVTQLGANSGLDLNISNYSNDLLKTCHDLNLFLAYYVTDDLGLLDIYPKADYITTNRITKASNINWENEVIDYVSSSNSYTKTYNDNEIKLFQDVISVTGFVYFNNASESIILGDQTYTPAITGKWIYIDLTFIKRVSGNTTMSFDCTASELIFRKYNYR